MSPYTVSEVLGYLVAASLLGGGIGWLIRGLRAPKHTLDVPDEARIDARFSEHRQAITQLNQLLADRQVLEGRAEEARRKFQMRSSELDRLKLVVAERTAQVDVLKAAVRIADERRSDEQVGRLRMEERLETCREGSVTLCRERDRSIDRIAFLEERLADADQKLSTAQKAQIRLDKGRGADREALAKIRGVVTQRDATISELQTQLSAKVETQELKEALRLAQSKSRSHGLGLQNTRVKDLEAALIESKRKHLVELEQSRRDVEKMSRQAEEQEHRIHDLEACVDGLTRDTDLAIGRLTAERDAKVQESEQLQHILESQEDVLESLENRLAIIDTVRSHYERTLETVEVETFELASDSTVEAARAEMKKVAQRVVASGESVPEDDLKRIRGIGPKIEAMLKEMGICSYRQIARLERGDIEIVGAALGTFPDRIRRDDWVTSARSLHIEMYGSDPVA